MPPEDLTTPVDNKAQKPNRWIWIWYSIVGMLIAKIFSPVGAVITIGAFYWLKPKLGVWWAGAASSVLGTVVAVGLFVMLKNIASPTAPVPTTDTHQSTNTTPAIDFQQEHQQRALLTATREIIAKHPQLDPTSPMVDQSAIDYVISRRDTYIANGHEVDIALRMAANDYGEQLSATQQRESEQRYAQQITTQRFNQPSVSQAQPVTNDYIRRKNEPCQAKAVMTDEDLARCRGR